jgi:hypothetical protein
MRLALKLATGAGKTTVMAMLIAWQTVNAVRRSGSSLFTKGFLIVAPGLTIKDRLRVLQPNDPDSYYKSRELVPADMLDDIQRAKIVITNYHSFKLRERLDISKGGRSLLQGRGEPLMTLETEGQMIQRVMPDLMGLKNILVLNDEAHHCYRERPRDPDEEDLSGDEKQEAEKNNEAARLWISGLEIVQRKTGINRVIDLSATPFFLRGSGYNEGTLFHWTMSDFSLMDAIECGIVKLPRVPVADNISGEETPVFRNLWEHIRKDMPKKGRGKGAALDPLNLPAKLVTALEALYGYYKLTFDSWKEAGISVPPCFIVVCNNTSTSKLVYDYISGFTRINADGSTKTENGRLDLFQNFDEHGNPETRLLLTTFSDILANALRAKLRLLINSEPRLGERIEVHSMNAIGRRLYELNIGKPQIASRETARNFLKETASAVDGNKFSLQFLTTEWEQVVDAWQLETWDEYRDVNRLGRKTRLKEPQRKILWSIFEQVRSMLKSQGLMTDSGLFNILASRYHSGISSPFDFAVVDEVQDISIAQLRFLAALGAGRKNGLFFAGDLGQRIFQQPFSWKALGVDVRGRSTTLKINYRTSHQTSLKG